MITARRSERIAWLDRLTLAGMALGIAMMLQPWWPAGFRLGFFVTLASTIAQIVASHLLPGEHA